MKAVIIGRSGSGKSTLCDLIAKENVIPVINEVARTVLREMKYATPDERQQKIMHRQVHYEGLMRSFLSDRGLHDAVAYSKMLKSDTTLFDDLLYQRYDLVFRLPKIPFSSDGVRIEHNEKEADAFQTKVEQLYQKTGHRMIHVPYNDVYKRRDFILSHLQ